MHNTTAHNVDIQFPFVKLRLVSGFVPEAMFKALSLIRSSIPLRQVVNSLYGLWFFREYFVLAIRYDRVGGRGAG